jgi:exo-beta-1,3-glucanase (GH17 family)
VVPPHPHVKARSKLALWSRFAIPTILCIALLLTLTWWLERWLLLPALLVNGEDSPITCVSYAPFRRSGASPTQAQNISSKEIEEDLRLIKKQSPCIRTYGVGKGLDAVPAIAEKLGLRVKQGIWLGRDLATNQREIKIATNLAIRFPKTIECLIVGNEVLLRQDLTSHQLMGYLKQVRLETSVPITYADVWEFWRQNATLREHVDFVTIHILPFWEDQPVKASESAKYVFDTLHHMQKEFSPTPIWLGETGWPSAGRQREGAKPGTRNQRRVVQEILLRAALEKESINLIEAFDQPWKRNLEGGMGGAWGLLRSDGSSKITARPELPEESNAWRGLLGACLGGLSMAALFPASRRLRKAGPIPLLCASLLGALLPAQLDFLALWGYTSALWQWGLIMILVSNLASVGLAFHLIRGVVHESDRSLVLATMSLIALLAIAIDSAWLLWIDPRYRGFPFAVFMAPASMALAVAYKHLVDRATLTANGCHEHRLFSLKTAQTFRNVIVLEAAILLLLAFLVGWQEGLRNDQAIGICALWTVLGLSAFSFQWRFRWRMSAPV